MTITPRMLGQGLLCALLVNASASIAAADVLILKNGDRITGSISRIWDAEIIIEPDYADEFSVDIDAVESIEAEREFEIELASGREITAQLLGTDAQGNQVVSADGELLAVPLAQLRELEEPEDYFDWDANADVSVGITKGNTDSENSKLRADGFVKFGDHRHLGEVQFNREELDGVETQKQDLLTYDYNWLFNDPWFFAMSASYERDPIRDLDRRISIAPAIGRDIWNDPWRFLNFSLGAGYQNEKIAGVEEDNSVAIWKLRFMHKFLSNDLEAYHNHRITTTISGRDNTAFKTTTGVKYDINDHLYSTLSVDYDYETDPAAGAEKDDMRLLFGLGVDLN